MGILPDLIGLIGLILLDINKQMIQVSGALKFEISLSVSFGRLPFELSAISQALSKRIWPNVLHDDIYIYIYHCL